MVGWFKPEGELTKNSSSATVIESNRAVSPWTLSSKKFFDVIGLNGAAIDCSLLQPLSLLTC
jgi:AAA+ superfamily predicted ATPase